MGFFTDKTKLFARAVFIFLFILVGLFASPQQVQALWDGNLYQPGTTLNPECTPTQTSCNIVPPISQNGDQSLSGTLTVTPTTAVGLSLNPYGTNLGNTSELRFLELAVNGNNFVAFKSVDALTGNVIWTLPNADGTNGQMLVTDGSGALSWVTNSGASSLAAPIGTNANGGSIASNVLTLSLADGTNPGLVSTGTQTFAGDKTLANNLTVNGNTTLGDTLGDTLTLNSSSISIPNNLNIDSDTLYLDATNNRVGIGITTPGAKLAVATGATGDIFSAASVTTLPLTGWSTRQIVTVNNANASSLTNYQVRMTVNTATLVTAGLLQSDGRDLRFTSSNGTTLLNHFVESGMNTASTVVWVKVPTLAVGNTSLFMYYGNSVATTTSSPTAVFDLYQNFTTNASLSDWTVNNMDTTTIPGTVSGSQAGGGSGGYIASNAAFTSGVIAEFYEIVDVCIGNTGNDMVVDAGFRVGTGSNGLAGSVSQLCPPFPDPAGNGPDTRYNNGTRTNMGASSVASGNFISVALKSASLADVTVNSITASNVAFDSSGSFKVSFGTAWNGGTYGGFWSTERIQVRRYAATVPTVTLAADPTLGVQERLTVNNNGNVLFGQYNDGLIAFDMPGATYDRRMRITAGLSDTADNSQGASIDLHGNDHANAGALDLVAGGTTGAITAWTNNTQRLIIGENGNVAIGATTPSATARLYIEDSAATSVNNFGLVTTGGSVSTIGGDTLVTYNGSGSFTPPNGVTSVQVLVVSGGGGGAAGENTALGGVGGGGGGGDVVNNSALAVTQGNSIAVTVGAGGTAGALGSADTAPNAGKGGQSSFSTVIATGGGGGGGDSNSPAGNRNGANGGGGSGDSGTAGTGNVGGFAGGAGNTGFRAAGGGGGDSQTGEASNIDGGGQGGDGGAGTANSISGSSVVYGSGAGGGASSNNGAQAGGTGGSGAGNGATSSGSGAAGSGASNGTANRGGGGGGGSNTTAGAGGSGVVIVRFATVVASTQANQAILHIKNTGSDTGSTLAFFETGASTGCIIAGQSGLSCSSDARLKKNFLELVPDAMDNLLKLQTVTYDWNNEEDGAGNHYGFVAQDVESLFPQLVTIDPNGNKAVNYAGFAPLLTAGLKELNSQVEVHSLQIGKIGDLIGLSTNNLNAVKLEYLTGVTAENSERFATLKAEWDTLREEQQFITSRLDQTEATQNLPTVSPSQLEKLVISGALTVGNLEVLGESIFRNIATFTADANFEKAVVFAGDVIFKGRTLFEDQDMAGFAKIALGQDRVEVKYDKEYPQAPVVQAGLSSVALSDAAYEVNTLIKVCSKDESREVCEEKATKDALSFNRGYAVVSSTTKGFTILLENPALYDLTFNWIAIPVKDARTQVNEVTPSPSPSPTPDTVVEEEGVNDENETSPAN